MDLGLGVFLLCLAHTASSLDRNCRIEMSSLQLFQRGRGFFQTFTIRIRDANEENFGLRRLGDP